MAASDGLHDPVASAPGTGAAARGGDRSNAGDGSTDGDRRPERSDRPVDRPGQAGYEDRQASELSRRLERVEGRLHGLASAAAELLAADDAEGVLPRLVAQAAHAVDVHPGTCWWCSCRATPATSSTTRDSSRRTPNVWPIGCSARPARPNGAVGADGGRRLGADGTTGGWRCFDPGEPFDPDDGPLLATYCDYGAAALDVLEARREARAAAVGAGALLDLGRKLTVAATAADVARLVADAAPAVVGARRAVVGWADGDRLVVGAGLGDGSALDELPSVADLAAAFARGGTVLAVDSTSGDGSIRQLLAAIGGVAMTVAAMTSSADLIGFVAVEFGTAAPRRAASRPGVATASAAGGRPGRRCDRHDLGTAGSARCRNRAGSAPATPTRRSRRNDRWRPNRRGPREERSGSDEPVTPSGVEHAPGADAGAGTLWHDACHGASGSCALRRSGRAGAAPRPPPRHGGRRVRRRPRPTGRARHPDDPDRRPDPRGGRAAVQDDAPPPGHGGPHRPRPLRRAGRRPVRRRCPRSARPAGLGLAGSALPLGEGEQPTVRVGVAMASSPGDTADALLEAAGQAADRARPRPEQDPVLLLAAGTTAATPDRPALEPDLQRAVAGSELFVVYQPYVDLRTDTVVGLEALVRWRHPRHGVLEPDVFIPVAEESDLIVAVDSWVLHEACRQHRAWVGAGLRRTPADGQRHEAGPRQRPLRRRRRPGASPRPASIRPCWSWN